jgi:hypothetical protein
MKGRNVSYIPFAENVFSVEVKGRGNIASVILTKDAVICSGGSRIGRLLLRRAKRGVHPFHASSGRRYPSDLSGLRRRI